MKITGIKTTYSHRATATPSATGSSCACRPIEHHVRVKFLNGSSLGLAERSEVDFAWKMLGQVKSKVGDSPGLVAGIVKYGD